MFALALNIRQWWKYLFTRSTTCKALLFFPGDAYREHDTHSTLFCQHVAKAVLVLFIWVGNWPHVKMTIITTGRPLPADAPCKTAISNNRIAQSRKPHADSLAALAFFRNGKSSEP